METPSNEDAADLKEFTRPLLGRRSAALGIKHARYEHDDGKSKTVVEYVFDETELNRSAMNIDSQLLLPSPIEDIPDEESGGLQNEVMLFLEQANREPGKEKGRTGDRGMIPDISDKVLPDYFRKSIQGLKMLQGEENPFEVVFVVDVHAVRLDGVVKAYTVTEIHDSFKRDD